MLEGAAHSKTEELWFSCLTFPWTMPEYKVRNIISVLRVCSIDRISEEEYTGKSPVFSSTMIFGPVESYRQN